ncbi:hypothetical protein [Planococcus beigongshangi]|uniref:hypothetical protein n=1 Tax=Planococcus beigongshangi TaxID=2782536 RepID=UPI00193BC310|nr:hypothetical protein [Planococcus beigongshangi]
MKTVEAFKKLWPERLAALSVESEEDMRKMIVVELNDELTHPRVRKTKQQKLELAVKRIEESELDDQEKEDLISFYRKVAAQID